jgi:hypothetical protein
VVLRDADAAAAPGSDGAHRATVECMKGQGRGAPIEGRTMRRRKR